jgi:multicomponent Na+:H+ antiporter subunit F
MIKGPTIWDRLVCMNQLSAKVIVFIVLLSIISKQSFLLDIAIVYALFSFVSTVIIARFIKKKGGI